MEAVFPQHQVCPLVVVVVVDVVVVVVVDVVVVVVVVVVAVQWFCELLLQLSDLQSESSKQTMNNLYY